MNSVVGHRLSASFTLTQSDLPSSWIWMMYPLMGLPPSLSGGFQDRVTLYFVLSAISGAAGMLGGAGEEDSRLYE